MRTWEDAGLTGLRVAVNLSPRQFRDPQLAEKIGSALAEAGIEPRMLCLEITENVVMLDTPASQAMLTHLRSLGIDLVLDDFGTGYSSLNYLKKFAFDKVKIDRSFVSNITTDSNDGAIATAIVSMAHSLGIRVVAEGVETEVQCDFLRRNMCDEIQGFLFSPALSADDTAALLREERRLPDHLLRLNRPQRTLLIVDDEVNIVSSLKRLLRRDNYNILTANSGMEGLEVLARNDVDVIVSDQRMPGMTGVEFLGKAKELYPDTVRLVLSGYTELQSVTDAVNQGAIYKFLMKPWDDTQLREHIGEAFQRKEMADENRRLTLEVRTANFELAAANRKLEEVLQQQQQQISRDEVSLDVVREVLQQVPAPAIGLDEDNFIAFVNTAAQGLFRDEGMMLGADARTTIPEVLHAIDGMGDGQSCSIQIKGSVYRVRSHSMGQGSESRGKLLTLMRD
jgi:EAL domain-containing protein (putative c-di-GMP-specific phosphodiesterase class I)/FixJ family two-component response regulator